LYSVHSAFSFNLSGSCEAAVTALRSDFAYFAVSGDDPQATQIEVNLEAPDYEGLPVVDASVYTPRNVVYHVRGTRILDFGGRGLAFFDPAQRHFRVASLDADLVYEAANLFLLSRIGEACDKHGLNRLHALGMAYRGRSILAVLPMGGGKSTLCAELLKCAELRVLSDDSPFIDRRSRAHAFPLRLGLLEGSDVEVPPEFVRVYRRMEFGPKRLVDSAYFRDRVQSVAEPGLLIIGRRTLAAGPRIERASYRRTMEALLPAMILGVGLFQGLEFLLRSSLWDLTGQIGTVWGRSVNAHLLARRSHCYIIHLGRDKGANAAAIVELAKAELG